MSEEVHLKNDEYDNENEMNAEAEEQVEQPKQSVTVINANLEMYNDANDDDDEDENENEDAYEENPEEKDQDDQAVDNKSSNYDRLYKAEELESFQEAAQKQIHSERGHVRYSDDNDDGRPRSQGAQVSKRVDMSTGTPFHDELTHKELFAATRESHEAAEPRTTKEEHASGLSTTRANLEPSATVKFQLVPLNQVVTQAFPLNIKIKEMKEKFAADLKMEPKFLKFYFETKTEHRLLDNDHIHLSELGVEANGIVGFKIESIDQDKYPLKAYEQREKDLLIPADVITVNVTLGNGITKEIIVEIVRQQQKKPFIGGFRHKYTNQVYLNASSQTRRKFDAAKLKNKLCRDTQTIQSHHIKLQTRQDMSTQMTKPGVFVSRVQDKLLTPRPYQTADQLHQIRVTSCIIIQKYFRRWLAKKRFNVIKLAYEERVRWEKEKELARIREIEMRRQMDINRRLNPRTKDDFEILYAALEKWRNEELAKINATKTGAARKAALAMLVDQEAELIATIERYKIEANKEIREKQINFLLQKMSEPKIWKCKDGSKTELDTPYNIRAKELKDIYNSLNMKYLTQDERLDVLLTLKHTVQEHDCKLTQEIIKLIDREADLLMRGIKEENLSGLRLRISSLFLQYIKTPQFNPAIAKHLKVPQDINDTQFSMDNFYCTTCGRYLPSIEFQISSTNTKVGKCRTCKNVENLAIKRVDYTKFKFLLNKIQIDEKNFETMFMNRPQALSPGPDSDNYKKSKICYLLTEHDIHYMFDKIWNSQSILSANQDIYQLHFVRWNKNEEWSPWNTILLTLDEADSHLKLTNLELNYGEPFIKKIRQRHVMARNYFLKLPKIAEYLKRNEPVSEPIRLPSLTGIKIQ